MSSVDEIDRHIGVRELFVESGRRRPELRRRQRLFMIVGDESVVVRQSQRIQEGPQHRTLVSEVIAHEQPRRQRLRHRRIRRKVFRAALVGEAGDELRPRLHVAGQQAQGFDLLIDPVFFLPERFGGAKPRRLRQVFPDLGGRIESRRGHGDILQVYGLRSSVFSSVFSLRLSLRLRLVDCRP